MSKFKTIKNLFKNIFSFDLLSIFVPSNKINKKWQQKVIQKVVT